MSTCEICKLDLSAIDSSLTCDVCFSTVHSLCVKRENKKFNKWTCQICSDIKPAHTLFVLKELNENLKTLNQKIVSIESFQDSVCNKLKSIDNNIGIVMEEVQSLFKENTIITEKFDNNYSTMHKLFESADIQLRKLNGINNGVMSLLSIFDNDEPVSISNKIPSSDKLINNINNLRNDISDIAKTISNPVCCKKVTSEIINSCKPVICTTSKSTQVSQDTLVSSSSLIPNNGWRLLGAKMIWKNDWAEYDAKCRRRELSEKHRINQRRKKKKINNNNKNIKSTDNSVVEIFDNINNSPDKSVVEIIDKNNQLPSAFNRNSSLRQSTRKLPTTAHFRSNPYSATHTQSTSKKKIEFINFQQGETLNPSIADNKSNSPNFINFHQGETTAPSISEKHHSSWIDPTTSPVVKSTIISSNSDDGLYMISRLNDHKTYNIIRNYLAYLHDQPPSVVHEGMTCISSRVRIGAEGLPTDIKSLRNLYDKFNARFGFTPKDTQMDLDAVRSHFQASRITTLQRNRENFDRFYKGSSKPNF